MITYALARAHPLYRALLPALFDDLYARYPRANLKRVETFAPKREDLSIGNVDDPGTVRLSERWFGTHPDALAQAARTPPLFHGPLTRQPIQAAAHEFGHALIDGLGPDAQARAKECWRVATRDPNLALSPYALAASGNEFFSELLAAVELGVARPVDREQFEYVIGEMTH